jgi:hypothetical protein
MPWHVAKSSDCPATKPWAVIKNSDGSVVACHTSEKEADAQMAALYANVPDAKGKQIERRTSTTELTVVESKHRSAVPTLRGYASVFNQIDGPAGAREMVAPGAFTRSLRAGDPVTALWNHNPDFVIASTKNGSLRLSEDSHGLLAEMTPIDTPTIRDLVIKPIQDGMVNKMSFGFETVKDEYTTDKGGPLRVLRDLTLFDVSPVVFPWYSGTDISARSGQDQKTGLSWAAGFFDGEGSFSLHKVADRRYFKASVTQNDRGVLDRFVIATGLGKVLGPYQYRERPDKTFFTYEANGEDAKRVFGILYPHLSEIKVAQATRALTEIGSAVATTVARIDTLVDDLKVQLSIPEDSETANLLTASAALESQEGSERQAQIAGAIAADAHARRLILLELLKKGFLSDRT